MTDLPNLRVLSSPHVDTAVTAALAQILKEAEAGEVVAVAAIVARRSGEWTQHVVGDTAYHNLAGLNLRVDMLKRLLLDQVRIDE